MGRKSGRKQPHSKFARGVREFIGALNRRGGWRLLTELAVQVPITKRCKLLKQFASSACLRTPG
jgi:hypothetical protein